MNKKNIFSVLTAAVLIGAPALTLTSCEDTLDKPSFTADDLDFVFEDENKAELFIKGCYRDLVYEELWRPLIDPTITGCSEEDLIGGRPHTANFGYDVLLPATPTKIYSQSYKSIEACNVALERLAGLPETAKVKALKAEAIFIRAFSYNQLIRTYGNVPAQFTPISSVQDKTWFPECADRDMIYDRIIDEMVACVDDLPWFSESGYGSAPERLTRQAAKGILARICLYAGGYSLRWNTETNDPATLHMGRRDDEARVREFYTIANTQLEDIFAKNENHLLRNGADGMSAFQTLFFNYCQRNYGVTSEEMLWQIAQFGQSTNSSFGIYNGSPGSMGGTYGGRRTLQVKLPTYYYSFDANDTRRDVTCCNYTCTYLTKKEDGYDDVNCATTFSSIGGGKFRIQWCVAPYAAADRNVDVPMLRYADVLLMYAEVQNYLNGPTPAAIAAVKEVRDRAGIGSMPIASGSREEFLETIMQERKWELADELLIRGDLIRTNLISKHIRQAQQDIKDFSDKTGKYADVAPYRLVKLVMGTGTYGDNFLTLPYVEITDPDEIDKIFKEIPKVGSLTQRKDFQAKVDEVAAAHGLTGTWYPVRMFEPTCGSFMFNKNARRCAGFSSQSVSEINIGNSIATKPTGRAENKGNYPDWVAGTYGIYYGFEENKTELCPFAAKSAGHPLIDNPNLTQHPAYK